MNVPTIPLEVLMEADRALSAAASSGAVPYSINRQCMEASVKLHAALRGCRVQFVAAPEVRQQPEVPA